MAVSLSDVLSQSSFYLGETSVPTSETTGRTVFANESKREIAEMRNWTFELKTGTPINIVANTKSYALPADFKSINAMYVLPILDSKGNTTYYAPKSEQEYKYLQVNNMPDPSYWVDGESVAGYTLYLNPTPTVSVTGGIVPRYYSTETPFVNSADTTRIPCVEVMAWAVAARVLFGYREQAQYQLATNEYNNQLQDMLNTDLKVQPGAQQKITSFRNWAGQSTNFKTFY